MLECITADSEAFCTVASGFVEWLPCIQPALLQHTQPQGSQQLVSCKVELHATEPTVLLYLCVVA